MPFAYPSYTNVFIPGYGGDVAMRLAVEYTRNWKEFPFLMMCTRTTIPQPTFIWKRIDPTSQGRVINNPQAYLFNDGQARPINSIGNKNPFEYVTVEAKRRSFDDYLGNLTEEFSPDEELNRVVNTLGNQAMTEMAVSFYTELSTTGNYLTGHTDTATNLGGGVWANATSSNKYIQKTLNAVRRQLVKATYGNIKQDDLILVMGPELADVVGRCQEVADGFYRQEQFADHLQFKVFKNQWSTYGVPPVLYGFNIVVDETLRTTSKPQAATATTSFLPTADSAYVITKPGFLKGDNGNTAFSSIHLFEPKGHELKVETFDEPHNKRKLIAAETFYDLKFVGKEASFLITSC